MHNLRLPRGEIYPSKLIFIEIGRLGHNNNTNMCRTKRGETPKQFRRLFFLLDGWLGI